MNNIINDIINEKDLYLAIIDNVPEGVYCVDESRRIFFWNKAAEKISGYKASEMISKSCSESELSHVNKDGLNLCKSFCPLVGTMFDGQVREENVFLKHKDGRRIAIKVRTYPLYSNGKSVGAIEFFHEI